MRTSIRVKEIISTKRRALFCLLDLVYCLLCVCPRPYTIYFIRLRHDIADLCWKCRYTPQTTNRTGLCLLRSNSPNILCDWSMMQYVAGVTYLTRLQCWNAGGWSKTAVYTRPLYISFKSFNRTFLISATSFVSKSQYIHNSTITLIITWCQCYRCP